jgi:hypothetical protein
MPPAIKWAAFAALMAFFVVSSRVPAGMQLSAAAAAEAPVSAAGGSSLSSPMDAATTSTSPLRDEMLFGGSGQRQHWTSVPALVVLTSVMQYRSGARDEYAATSEVLTADAAENLVDDLTDALRLLTHGTFERFDRIDYETAVAGANVSIVRPRQIVVARYQGLQDVAHTIGLGGRKAARNGAIIGAAILLDNEFDRSSGKRRLLRTHELGHALGYNHVTSRPSIMNPRIGPQITDTDRQVVMRAFLRPGARDTEN